jgi:hypothetical protein
LHVITKIDKPTNNSCTKYSESLNFGMGYSFCFLLGPIGVPGAVGATGNNGVPGNVGPPGPMGNLNNPFYIY